MAAAKTGGNKKTEGLKIRKYNGQVVKNCLYNGRAVGQGKYFAAMIGDQLVLDEAGRPIPFNQLGTLE